MSFEHHREPLLPRSAFLQRQLRYLALALLVIATSLAFGTLGFRYLEDIPWLDAFVNAALVLSGIGFLSEVHQTTGKLFASFYALCSSMIVLISVGIIVAPVVHRVMHRFHLQTDESSETKEG